MGFSINLGGWNSVFAVPSAVVDQHIKLAGSAQLKVLLWILRHAGENFDASVIAAALNMHPMDVNDAMQYWIETGLLIQDGESLSPGEGADITQKTAEPLLEDVPAPDHNVKELAPPRPRPLSRPQKPDAAFVAKRINECPEISYMMQEAQVILGKPISNGDCATLLMLHETDGLPVDVILMLLQYTVGIGKGNMRYIEKMAVSWADEGIDSHEKAEHKIRALSQGEKAWRLVQGVIGLDKRSPSTRELEAAQRWVVEWKFGDSLIREAYERCVDNKGKYILGYMDSILRRWHSEGIRTLEQAHMEKREKKSAPAGYTPSYDLDAYERTSIFDESDSSERKR
jgi:DnaD/phage-associated family protein